MIADFFSSLLVFYPEKYVEKFILDLRLHKSNFAFRHTTATHLNKVAGVEITQHVLGHSRRANTLKYAHLNPDKYAVYMKQHPFMQADSAKATLATTAGKEAL